MGPRGKTLDIFQGGDEITDLTVEHDRDSRMNERPLGGGRGGRGYDDGGRGGRGYDDGGWTRGGGGGGMRDRGDRDNNPEIDNTNWRAKSTVTRPVGGDMNRMPLNRDMNMMSRDRGTSSGRDIVRGPPPAAAAPRRFNFQLVNALSADNSSTTKTTPPEKKTTDKEDAARREAQTKAKAEAEAAALKKEAEKKKALEAQLYSGKLLVGSVDEIRAVATAFQEVFDDSSAASAAVEKVLSSFPTLKDSTLPLAVTFALLTNKALNAAQDCADAFNKKYPPPAPAAGAEEDEEEEEHEINETALDEMIEEQVLPVMKANAPLAKSLVEAFKPQCSIEGADFTLATMQELARIVASCGLGHMTTKTNFVTLMYQVLLDSEVITADQFLSWFSHPKDSAENRIDALARVVSISRVLRGVPDVQSAVVEDDAEEDDRARSVGGPLSRSVGGPLSRTTAPTLNLQFVSAADSTIETSTFRESPLAAHQRRLPPPPQLFSLATTNEITITAPSLDETSLSSYAGAMQFAQESSLYGSLYNYKASHISGEPDSMSVVEEEQSTTGDSPTAAGESGAPDEAAATPPSRLRPIQATKRELLKSLIPEYDCALVVRLDRDAYAALQWCSTERSAVLSEVCDAFVAAHRLKRALVFNSLLKKCLILSKKQECLLSKKMAAYVRLPGADGRTLSVIYSVVDLIALMD